MLILLAAFSAQAQALGLGPITLQSGLGSPLEARIPVYGAVGEDLAASCIKTRVTALDGNLLSRPAAQLMGSGANAAIKITGREGIAEPAVNITVEIGCASGVRRDYQVLLDPLPAAQLAKVAEPVRPLRADRLAAQNKAGVAAPAAALTSATPPPAADPVVRKKPPAPPSPKPAAVTKPAMATKSVLTLSTGDAEIEQVRANLALRYATTLSEPRLEADAAKLAAMRADQARVAALMRGENPSAAAQAQLRDAQLELRSARLSALAAKQELEAGKAALEAERQSLLPASWTVILAGLLCASMAAMAWLMRRRAEDRRRHQDALLMLSTAHDMPPETASAAPPPSDATIAPAGTAAPAAAAGPAVTQAAPTAGFQSDVDPGHFSAATSAPQAIELPDSWLAIEQQIGDLRNQQPDPSGLAVHSLLEGPAQDHASEVAGMLLTAENWMSEHNPLRAAEVLRSYLEREDMLSPAPGLYLMALYQTVGDQERLKTVQARLEQYFPEEAAYWLTSKPRLGIADFPEVRAMVDTLGHSSALLPYLNGLLLAPEKFDFSAYRDIVRAIGIAMETAQTREMQSMSLDFS